MIKILLIEEVRRAEYFRAQDYLVRAAWEITDRELFLFEAGMLSEIADSIGEYALEECGLIKNN